MPERATNRYPIGTFEGLAGGDRQRAETMVDVAVEPATASGTDEAMVRVELDANLPANSHRTSVVLPEYAVDRFVRSLREAVTGD